MNWLLSQCPAAALGPADCPGGKPKPVIETAPLRNNDSPVGSSCRRRYGRVAERAAAQQPGDVDITL
jgi:hypothetical protein